MAGSRGQKEKSRAEQLGALVRKLRRASGYTLNQLAEKVPMSPSNLSRIELGSQGPPTEEVIEHLARALGAPAALLREAAGLRSEGESFEATVMERLDQLGREVREVREAVVGGKVSN